MSVIMNAKMGAPKKSPPHPLADESKALRLLVQGRASEKIIASFYRDYVSSQDHSLEDLKLSASVRSRLSAILAAREPDLPSEDTRPADDSEEDSDSEESESSSGSRTLGSVDSERS